MQKTRLTVNFWRLALIAVLLVSASLACRQTSPTPTPETPAAAQPAAAKTDAPAAAQPGGEQPAGEQPAAGPTTAPAATQPAGQPLPALGEVQRSEEGGFSYASVPGWTVQAFGGLVGLLAPGADPDVGPQISLMGGINTGELTNEDLYNQLLSGTDLQVGPAEAITVQGVPGLAADLDGTNNGKAMHGRVVMVMVTPQQQFTLLAGAPAEGWADLEPLYLAVLASVEFFEPAPMDSPTSGLEPGWTVFSNANQAKDLLVLDGVAYAATHGGLVAWDLASGYPTKYTPLDGMTHISSQALARCDLPDRRLVVGTYNGLSFFDPATGQWDTTSLPVDWNRVQGMKVDRLLCDAANQRLLIAYSGLGILDLEKGSWKQITTKEGLSWNSITDIAVLGDSIWVASGYNGITQIRGEEVKVLDEAGGLPSNRANALAAGPDGALWVGGQPGLARLKDGKWTLYTRDTTPGMPLDIVQLEFAADGTLWAASSGAGKLCAFDPARATCTATFAADEGHMITALALDESGQPVFSTRLGVYYLEGGSTRHLALGGDYLAGNFVDSFAADVAGWLWVGTDSGLHRLDPAYPTLAWDTYRSAREGNAPGGNWANAIAGGPDGSLWFAIINGSASRFKDGQWTVFKDYYSYDRVAVDGQGRAWFGDDKNGIVVLDTQGQVAFTLTTAQGLPSDNIRALLVDGDSMWIGTVDGLARYTDEKVEIVFSKDDPRLLSDNVTGLWLEADGSLLLGLLTGVARWDGAQVTALLDFRKEKFNGSLSALAVDPNGRIWVGTTLGLYYSDDETTWTRLTTADGLPTDNINALFVDQFGSLWVGGGSSYDGGGLLHIVP